MEVLGIAFTLLNSIVFLTFSICRKTNDLLLETKNSIMDEFSYCQKDFGEVFYGAAESLINHSIDRMRRLIFTGHSDIHVLGKYGKELQQIIITAFFGFILSIISLLLGFFISGQSTILDMRTKLILGFPFSILIFESIVLLRSFTIEKKVKAIKNKYRTRSY